MSIVNGNDVVATDFINQSEANATPANDAGRVAKLENDGKLSGFFMRTPVVRKYDTTSSNIGDSTTRFDITNPSGTTFRYTYDGTGTDPLISLANNPIGSLIGVQNTFSAGNRGIFVVTGAGTNYFEVTNASGVAENDQLVGGGFITKSGATGWTKPTGLKYITVEVQAGGSGGGTGSGSRNGGSGGAGGGWSFKTILAATLNSTEYYLVGYGGAANSKGSASAFGSHLNANGGAAGASSGGTATGGTASGGDINVTGQSGAACPSGFFSSTGSANRASGHGGSSKLGFGGTSVWVAATDGLPGIGYGAGGSGGGDNGLAGGVGTQGIIILTEYY